MTGVFLCVFSAMHTCDAHVVAMEGVCQAVSHHGVLQGGVAHFHTCSHVQRVRSLETVYQRNITLFVFLTFNSDIINVYHNLPCSYSPCRLPPPPWTLQTGWIELPDTRPSAQSRTPSGSSRPGQGKGCLLQRWPDEPGSAHDLEKRRRNQTDISQQRLT